MTMAAKKKQAKSKPDKPKASALIITVSQLGKLSDEEKQKFREAGGTVTNDPS